MEVAEKQKIFGRNEIITKEKTTLLSLFISQLPTFTNAILMGAAILSFAIKNFIDGIFIFSVLVLNALFGFMQEYRAEKSLQKLKDYIKHVVRVIRGDQDMEIPTSDLVPGTSYASLRATAYRPTAKLSWEIQSK